MSTFKALRSAVNRRTAGPILAFVVLAGCNRATQIGAENRRLLESLKTAVMAENPTWLEENRKLVESGHNDGTLSDSEFQALDAIVREAAANNWPTAKDRVMRLAKGQAPAR